EPERERVLEAGWSACSLGSTILRAETAGIAALAIVQAAWAELGD
ncbi:MAG: 16S rRNA (uracil(1498)-N(3))-methyltransferase, partial [Bryobacteraceae bacterium]